MAVVADVASLAAAHLGRALEYTLLVPARAETVRLFVLVPLALAFATLALVRASPDVLVPGKAVKVSRQTVASALERARDAVGNDLAIRELCEAAASGEL